MKNRMFTLKKVLIYFAVLVVLVVSFIYGGNAPGYKHSSESKSLSVHTDTKKSEEKITANTDKVSLSDKNKQTEVNKVIDNVNEEAYKSHNEKEPEKIHDIKEEKTNQKSEQLFESNTCYISVKCDTILSNKDFFNKDKLEILPPDGVILPESKVEFKDGESVFSVTHRVLKQNKIHFEFTDNPMYSSVYVEGISNVYEFDCGDLSGWMYSVNGVFPNYGCSGYRVKEGDIIEWKYTCNLGEDVGNRFCGGRQQKK